MSAASQNLLGRRIELDGHFGVVKYIGPVGNSRETWLGIDWDEPERGRHNGTHNGVQYFKAAQETSASFVKANRVSTGISLLAGIAQRYSAPTDDRCGMTQSELAFESDLNIYAKPIKLYGMVKAGQRMSKLATLNSVMLSGVPVAFCSEEDESQLSSRLPSLSDLDLSHTLFHDWAEVAKIANALPNLKAINLSQNVLASPAGFSPDPPDSFARIQSLVLNKAGLDWAEAVSLWRLMPGLRLLGLSYNSIDRIGELPQHACKLVELDLAYNPMRDGCNLHSMGRQLTSLRMLNLNGCQLTQLQLSVDDDDDGMGACNCGDSGDSSRVVFPALESLALASNQLADWASVAQLHQLPSLRLLMLLDNPLWVAQNEATSRQLAIARLPRLRLLNRSVIERDERVGAEIDYLKRHYAQFRDLASLEQSDPAVRQFNRLHPSFPALLAKLGAPDEAEMASRSARALKDSVLEVRLRCVRADTGEENKLQSLTKRLPGRMLVQHLIAFMRKAFRLPPSAKVELFYLCNEMPGIEYPMEVETREVLYYNISSGDTILARYS